MTAGTFLRAEEYSALVAAAPLVSIDLVVQNQQGMVLLGRRINRPAQGSWFVPGGRVRKGERLDDAFRRISEQELGRDFIRDQARFMGVYEHFYADSMYSDAIDTHYIVLAYRIIWRGEAPSLPLKQHDSFSWWPVQEMSSSESVHPHSRAYASALLLQNETIG